MPPNSCVFYAHAVHRSFHKLATPLDLLLADHACDINYMFFFYQNEVILSKLELLNVKCGK
jgi:hypothetical protein